MTDIQSVPGDVAYARSNGTIWSKVDGERHQQLAREGRLEWVPVGDPERFVPTEPVEIIED